MMISTEMVMSTFDLSMVVSVLDPATALLCDEYGGGWFDGGCYTLASLIVELYPDDTQVFHASREPDYRDHAVVLIKSSGQYFDADGLQTKSELINKMKTVEMFELCFLQPFDDFIDYPVLENIKKFMFDLITEQH